MLLQVWNIEKFTQGLFRDYTPPKIAKHWTRGRKLPLPGANRIDYMKRAFSGNGHVFPDVFVVLEALCAANTPLGDPMPLDSSAGVTTMVGRLNDWQEMKEWRVVPPLKCNPARDRVGKNVQPEVVAVFYRSDKFKLTGPCDRPAGGWSAPWENEDITGNPAKSGQVRYYDNTNELIRFPEIQNRSPFMVDLEEIGNKKRTFRLLFAHTSPRAAEGGVANIARIPELLGDGPLEPDVFIVAGDFNVDVAQIQTIHSYQQLENQGFKRMFTKRTREIYSTMYKKVRVDHWTDLRGSFPERNGYLQNKILDNFLYRYNKNYKIKYPDAKIVTGWVYDAVTGSDEYGSSMSRELRDIQNDPHKVAVFREWENYWHIRATSDHLSTYLEIK